MELSPAERRVWNRLPSGTRDALLGLPPTDLQTLLLSVAKSRASRIRPQHLLRRWREDRFVRPAETDLRSTAAAEAHLWNLLPPDFEGVELSPVAPIGTCSALAPVSQNRVVTTMRSTEVLSDATNALALEAATRRLRQPRSGAVHLAASHRLLRAQQFGPGAPAHFRLFSLVSSARDTGSGSTQARMLTLHLAYWHRVLPSLRLLYTVIDSDVLRERITDAVSLTVPVEEEPDRRRGAGYYRGAAIRLVTTAQELGDGGFTTWTAQLMNDAKELCFTSCLSIDRLATLHP
ncbi:hypothetical protein [Actinoplanes sp. NPDC051851]|uniref:hypothetical protein n=1 Tax=Actinoplanes sp. NPDC051851 TaxID=3154753 RepID=UPI003433A12D